MATYLVTGGAGFIGSHMVAALLERGDRVRVVDSLVTGTRANLDGLAPVEFIHADLADPGVARDAVRGVDYVLHQAAIPSVPRSVAEPLICHRANVEATVQMLVAARDEGVTRLVFAGSSSVFGNMPTLPKREDMPTNPLSPYALQKLMCEQYGQMFWALYGLETVTIRYFNVFGPRQDPSSPYSGVISLFIQALLEGKRPTIYGDGEQTRDFTYVANVVDGALKACVAPGAAGQVINVATGTTVSLNGLLAILKQIIGSTVEPHFEPARVGDVKDSLADIAKAEAILGYTPDVPLEEGLRQTIEWFRQGHPSSSHS